jgi:glycosyltransferase involved in cell wall biosynthesis
MLSFVIPAYNEEKYLGATLAAIHAAARSLDLDYEIVVADDASTDATAKVSEEGGARVVTVENRQISKTRNAGARAARGDRLIFVDGDTQVNAEVVRAALAALDAGAVGGGAIVTFPPSAPRWVHVVGRWVVRSMALLRWAAGCFVFSRRDAFEAVGGFDERHFAAEEIMFSIAMKKQGRFVILAQSVLTSPRKVEGRTAGDLLRMFLRLLVNGIGGVRRRESTQFWYDGKR